MAAVVSSRNYGLFCLRRSLWCGGVVDSPVDSPVDSLVDSPVVEIRERRDRRA